MLAYTKYLNGDVGWLEVPLFVYLRFQNLQTATLKIDNLPATFAYHMAVIFFLKY